MHEAVQHNLFLVKEHIGIFKAANNYDIYDPESGELSMECREEKLGVITKILRFTDYKRMTPFDIHIRDTNGRQVVRVRRGISVLLSKVEVFDENDTLIGLFQQRLFSIGGAFTVLDANERPVCELKGKWTGFDYRFQLGGRELAHVSKKWMGVGKEMFTSADNYMIEIADDVAPEDSVRQLILAAVMCIDMVLKE
jgi:uncharacterized protein YxjI